MTCIRAGMIEILAPHVRLLAAHVGGRCHREPPRDAARETDVTPPGQDEPRGIERAFEIAAQRFAGLVELLPGREQARQLKHENGRVDLARGRPR